jgi:hypothetical protein
MPGTVRPVVDERDGLLAFLGQQRDALRFAVLSLTDEQATAKPTASALSLAGLIKHIARVERRWIVEVLSQRELPERSRVQDWADEFRLLEGETLAEVLDEYAAVARETESIIADIDDLGRPVPVPRIMGAANRERGPGRSRRKRSWRGFRSQSRVGVQPERHRAIGVVQGMAVAHEA